MPGSDLASIIGAPELAPAPVAAAPVAAPAGAPPPLPSEPDTSLIARAAVAEGDPNNPASYRNIGGVILNRAAKSGQSVSSVLSQPDQFESYGNGHIQSVDPNSPAYKAALTATQGLKAGDVPYDSFYSPSIVAARGRGTPPFDPKSGTMIGSQLFGNGYAAPQTPQLADALGLTPDERAAIAAKQAPAATTTAGKATDTEGAFTAGPNNAPLTAAQAAWYKANTPVSGWSNVPGIGDQQAPYALQSGGVLPQTPGARYVDLDGNVHTVPGGIVQQALNTGAGVFQSLAPDLKGSADRLTGGQASVASPNVYGSDNDALANFGASDQRRGADALAGDAMQRRQYDIQHGGDKFAQTGRFAGQTALGTAAAFAVPELDAPAVLGAGGRVLAGGATNALRGVAATAPSVGANPNQSVAGQLAGGALAGVAAPAVLGAPGKAFSALTGLGRTVSPEVATLADAAQTKYGMQLRSGQVMGANGDRGAATADSNLLGSSPAVRDNNAAQRQQWMKGVTGTYGDPSGSVGEAALQAARDRIGGVMNDVASRNNIAAPAADALQTRISQIVGDAQSVLGDDSKPLLTMAEKIGSVRSPEGISGQSYQALTNKGAPLDRLAQSDNSNVAHYAQQMRDALDDGMEASASPQDVQDFQKARWQYKNLMTVAKLAPKAQDTVDGVISPALLSGAVNTNFKSRAFHGAGDLGELAKIGQVFMKEPANSFTPQRLADIVAPLRTAAEAAGLVGGGMALAQRPEAALGAGLSALAGWGAKSASQALKQNAIGGSASNIISRSLPNAPGTVIGNALSGVGKVARPVEIPLSALAGVRGLGAMTQSPVTP